MMGTSRTNGSLLILVPDESVSWELLQLFCSLAPSVVVGMGMAPIGLIYLNALPPVAGTIWEPLGGVGLLEKVCHRGGL